jgi:curved DNA-binding protein CbpA
VTARPRPQPRRRRRAATSGHQRAAGLFGALGLEAGPEVTDDDVRAAWRRIAAATHPDRADGGDPERFAAAAAAYTALRTRFGRGEALADLRAAPWPPGTSAPAGRAARAAPAEASGRLVFRVRHGRPGRLAIRVRRGRPGRLAVRVLAALSASAAAAATAGAQPATPALITGAVTWLVLTARHDLAPPRADQGPAAAGGDHDLVTPGGN